MTWRSAYPDLSIIFGSEETRDTQAALVDLLPDSSSDLPVGVAMIDGTYENAFHLSEEYFRDSLFGVPCIVCHGISAQGRVGPVNSFRLPGGEEALQRLVTVRDTTTRVSAEVALMVAVAPLGTVSYAGRTGLALWSARGLNATVNGVKYATISESYEGLVEKETPSARRFIYKAGTVAALEGMVYVGGDVASKVLSRAPKARVPWKYGDVGDSLGVTDKFGNITIKPGLVGDELAETIRHEAVHRFFSPRPGVIGNIRADIGMGAYQRSHLVRFLEEGIAESVATASLRRGFAFPLTHGYVSESRVFTEGVGYVMIVGGTACGVHKLFEGK